MENERNLPQCCIEIISNYSALLEKIEVLTDALIKEKSVSIEDLSNVGYARHQLNISSEVFSEFSDKYIHAQAQGLEKKNLDSENYCHDCPDGPCDADKIPGCDIKNKDHAPFIPEDV